MSTVTVKNTFTAQDRICVALDMDPQRAWSTAEKLRNRVGWLKVGMELFTEAGPDFVREIKQFGHRIFLDLKYHDIPNTVGRAVAKASLMGVDMLNIHAAGGPAMLKAAVTAECGGQRPRIIGVTLLTSLGEDELHHLCVGDGVSPKDYVNHMALSCLEAGLAGVVSSAKEAEMVRKDCGPEFLIVTPGIRPLWAAKKEDQQRVTTPSEAVKNGSDILVIGRPIYGAADPSSAAKKVADEIGQTLNIIG